VLVGETESVAIAVSQQDVRGDVLSVDRPQTVDDVTIRKTVTSGDDSLAGTDGRQGTTSS
jgi:hypothetical protein